MKMNKFENSQFHEQFYMGPVYAFVAENWNYKAFNKIRKKK